GVHREAVCVVAGGWRSGRDRFKAVAFVPGRLGAHHGAPLEDERFGHHRAALSSAAPACRAARCCRRDQQRIGCRAPSAAASDPCRIGGLSLPDLTDGVGYSSLLRCSRSKKLPSTLSRPVSQARAKLPGSLAMATTSSLLAVKRICAAGKPSCVSLIGSAPCGPSLVRNVTPRSETWQLSVRSINCALRTSASSSESRPVRLSSATRHSFAVAIITRPYGHCLPAAANSDTGWEPALQWRQLHVPDGSVPDRAQD